MGDIELGGMGTMKRRGGMGRGVRCALAVAVVSLTCVAAGGCRKIQDAVGVSVRPKSLRDVPAERLAFRLEPDISAEVLPESLKTEAGEEMLAPVKADFETRRAEERLVRTVKSPDGQRALALYETGATLEGDFRIDLYGADGIFIRNVLPPEITSTFPQEVAWSPDGQQFAFIGVKNPAATPTPTPDPGGAIDAPVPSIAADPNIVQPSPTVAPIIPSVQVFSTEQVYTGDLDGFNIKPLTTRDGLIYFKISWSPDNRALAALACKETEWNARRAENKTPAGRPRIVGTDAKERLLDDRLADAPPVWSPDASKVAAAFDKTVTVYDVAGERPTAANVPLEQPLRAAAVAYDASKLSGGTKTDAGGGESSPPASSSTNTTGDPLSFNAIVRLEWLQPETLLVQTGFVRIYANEPVTNYLRWHVLHLSPQAAVLTLRQRTASPARHPLMALRKQE